MQNDADVTALKEDDAYPAMPEDGYGWEKLFSERMCRHFREDFGLKTRVARFHNVYGPHGTWDGGREKAPAAICRKVIEAQADAASTRSRSGATASRRAASCTSTTASHGIDTHHAQRHSRADQPRLQRAGDDQRAGRHGRGDRRRRAEAHATIWTRPRACDGRNSDNTLIKQRARLGAEHAPATRPGADLRVDREAVPSAAFAEECGPRRRQVGRRSTARRTSATGKTSTAPRAGWWGMSPCACNRGGTVGGFAQKVMACWDRGRLTRPLARRHGASGRAARGPRGGIMTFRAKPGEGLQLDARRSGRRQSAPGSSER